MADEAKIVGPAWGYGGGVWGSTKDFKHHCCMLLVLAEEMRRLIRMPSCHTRRGFFLGC